MTTNKADVPVSRQTVAPPAAPKPQGSSARLAVLLGLLVLAIGALGYDALVAKPNCDAADKKLQEFVDEQNKLGVKEGAPITPDVVHKHLGMQPTWVEKHDADNYEIEYYCWWGHVPLINLRRHFIAVVYHGQEPRHFSSHHREIPPEEALPIVRPGDPSDDTSLPEPTTKDSDTPAAAESAPPAEAKAPSSADPAAAEPDPTKDK
jgi:hypothetical protein